MQPEYLRTHGRLRMVMSDDDDDEVIEVDFYLQLDTWVSMEGIDLEVMAKSQDPMGRLYFRRKPLDEES